MAVEPIGAAASAATAVNARSAAPVTPAAPVVESQATLLTGVKAVQPGEPAPAIDDVRDAVRKIEDVVSPAAQDLRFSIDDETGITVVKLIDTETQTVLRQIPTEEVMEISKALDKLQGLLVRNKA